jgi:hypothetical protein
VYRLGHGLVPVGVQAKFLAVTGHQQEGVVGTGPHDQDGEDARALRVHREVGVAGQQVDDGLRAEERDHGREDGQDPEDGAAVGRQQDEDHDAQGGEEQRPVDAGEGLRGVGGVPGRASHIGLEPVRAVRRLGPHVVDDRADGFPPVRADVERNDQLQRLPVLGGDGPDDLAVEVGELREGSGVVGDGLAVGSREPVDPLVEDHRRDPVGIGAQLDLPLERTRRLGVPRKPRRDLVVLLVGEATGQRSRDRRQRQPEHEDDPLEPSVADPGCERPAHHGALRHPEAPSSTAAGSVRADASEGRGRLSPP